MAERKTKIVGQADKEKKRAKPAEPKIDSELEESKERLNKVKNFWFPDAEEGRRKYDWQWLVRTLFVRGYQFARYQSGTNTFVLSSRTRVRIPINLIAAQMRIIRNQVVGFKPKWEAIPKVGTESAFENAKYSAMLLDNLYEKLGMRQKIKELVIHGLITSIGIMKFGWDPLENGREGEVATEVVDPFDFYIDPNATSPKDAEYVILAVRKPVDTILADPRYKTEGLEIQEAKELAASEHKAFLIQSTRGYAGTAKKETPKYTILKEAMIKERDESGETKIRIITYTDDLEYPLRDELTEMSDFPYEVYQADINPLEIYGEGWAKNVIPLNRVLNALESYVFEYNHFFAKGRFVIDKGAGVRSIINQHGQIIEKNPGYTVTSLPIAPLPSATFDQITNFRRYIEDIGGAHDVSLGRVPTGVRSGIGIAELRQADATNQDDLVDALEVFLVNGAKQIFKLVSKNYTSSRLMVITGKGGKPEYFYVVGKSSPLAKGRELVDTFGEMKLPIATIGDEHEVRVTVGSWLAYTKQARQAELKELYRIGAIDQKTLLEYLEFGVDTDAIIERSKAERLLQMRQQGLVRGERGLVTNEELAESENELMLEGKDQPVFPDDDHEVHLTIHREALEEDKRGVVKAHMNEHILQMKLVGAVAPPEARGAGGAEAETPMPTVVGAPPGIVPPVPGIPGGTPMPGVE